MSHVGIFPTGENPSAGSSQRKPPAVRIDESAVVPGIRFRPVRIASRRTRSGSKGARLLERTTGIEPVTSILARSRSDGSPAQWAGEQKTLPSPLRIPPELCPQTTTLAANARVASPARPHARQRTPQLSRTSAHRPPAPFNLPELLEIIPVPGYSGMGLMSFHQGFLTVRDPTLCELSRGCLSARCSFPVPLATAVTGGCGWIRTTVPCET